MEEKLNNFKMWLEEKNIGDLDIIDLQKLSAEIDYLIIGTAENSRHAQTLSDYIEEKSELAGYTLLGKEGRDSASWILLDFSDIIVNIFLAEERAKYNLEKLWADGNFVLSTRKENTDERL